MFKKFVANLGESKKELLIGEQNAYLEPALSPWTLVANNATNHLEISMPINAIRDGGRTAGSYLRWPISIYEYMYNTFKFTASG